MANLAGADRKGQDGGAVFRATRVPLTRLRRAAIICAVPVAAATGVTIAGLALDGALPPQAILLLYLAAVMVSALTGGSVPALLAAGLSIVAYDFCFTAPRFALTIADPSEVVALVMFVAVALVTGTLAARRRDATARAEARATATQGVLAFSAELAGATGLDATRAVTVASIGRALDAHVLLLTERNGGLEPTAMSVAGESIGAEDRAAALAARDARTRTGRGTSIHPDAAFSFQPLISSHRLLAVVGIRLNHPASFDAAAQAVLDAMLGQAAIAIDRALKAQESSEAALLRESERLQSALLGSLSHDFRTPLASITGAASSLRMLGERMDANTREDLLASIEEDADRLNRFVGNLMDMSRIDSGRLRARHDAVNVEDLVERLRDRFAAAHPDSTVEVSVEPGLPPAQADPVLLEHVIGNLLDNARKYAGTSGPISIFLRRDGDAVSIAVTDRGEGIPAAELERVFEKFYRRGGDGRPAGTGLGLSIARGFIVAMGGTIIAESPAAHRRGTRFLIRLKAAAAP